MKRKKAGASFDHNFERGWVMGEGVIEKLVKDYRGESLPLICGIHARLGAMLGEFSKYMRRKEGKRKVNMEKRPNFLRNLFSEIESVKRKEEEGK